MDVAISRLPLPGLQTWLPPRAEVSRNRERGTGTVLPKQASGQDLWILSWQSFPKCDRIYLLQESRELHNTLVLSIPLCGPDGRCDTKWPSLGGLQDQQPN